jgi:dienelactone hydrolase
VTPAPDPLAGYVKEDFTAEGKTRDVYRTGRGPAVVVISEIPGITPLVTAFGRRVAAAGCTAVVPRIFGQPGMAPSAVYAAQVFGWTCISREFATLARGKASPVTTWLRALAGQAHQDCGGPGVGVVGMCLTGGFALAMMVDDVVVAPVLSQPALPIPLGKANRRDLGISDDDLGIVKQRCTAGVGVLGLRFTGDRMAPAERFQRLKDELGDAFVAVELDSSPGNPYGHPRNAHSVLTEDLIDEEGSPTRGALDQVLEFLRVRLVTQAG